MPLIYIRKNKEDYLKRGAKPREIPNDIKRDVMDRIELGCKYTSIAKALNLTYYEIKKIETEARKKRYNEAEEFIRNLGYVEEDNDKKYNNFELDIAKLDEEIKVLEEEINKKE